MPRTQDENIQIIQQQARFLDVALSVEDDEIMRGVIWGQKESLVWTLALLGAEPFDALVPSKYESLDEIGEPDFDFGDYMTFLATHDTTIEDGEVAFFQFLYSDYNTKRTSQS